MTLTTLSKYARIYSCGVFVHKKEHKHKTVQRSYYFGFSFIVLSHCMYVLTESRILEKIKTKNVR